jgi:hypothetical protein
MTGRDLDLSQLTTELTDFLALPADLDLPALHSLSCRRTLHTGWQVRAFVHFRTDAEAYAAVETWARYAGGSVEVSEPFASPFQPSGMQRKVSTNVVVAEVSIEVTGAVDGLFEVPKPAQAVSV